MMHAVGFVGTCVGLPAKDLDAFDASSRDITYRTFLKWVGREVMREINEGFNHPTIKNDWHVVYAKGKWKGKLAVCMFHSGIHHIWRIYQ